MLKFKAKGYILVDFPKTLSQAKLLERKLSGFTSTLDGTKSEVKKDQETWEKLVMPAKAPLSSDKEMPV